jgi:phosphohistidine phosphatase
LALLLYLVQHAEAKSKEEDPARDLTEKGREDLARVARQVGNLRMAVSRILHSGKTRAQTTAEILAASLQPSQGIAATDGLAPLEDPGIWADRLADLDEDVMLVGHLPHLARLAGRLMCGDQQTNPVNFQMGGMVCLQRLEAGHWAVEWMLTPAVLG